MTNVNFKNKKVVIFGLGSYKYGSGISAAKFFIKHGANVLITDLKFVKQLKDQVVDIKKFSKKFYNQPTFILEKHREGDFKNADIVIRNPGVPANNKYLAIARKSGAQIYTDISLFLSLLKAKNDQLKVKIIGITGTRGKSTTSALLAHILKKSGRMVFLGGNMGRSPLNFIDQLQKQSKLNKVYVVLEMSSWMTESLDPWKLSLQHATITNLYPDHLNTYTSMREYINAKVVIFKYQKNNDFLFLNKDNVLTKNLTKRARSKIIWFSKNNLKGEFNNLRGEHNRENISAALAMAQALGVRQKIAVLAVHSFRGLPGRLEFIRELHGVKFYNDTTSTMPEATLQALKTLGNNKLKTKSYKLKAQNIILIAGGADKELDYKELAREIPKYVKALVLFKGKASEKLKSKIKNQKSQFRNTALYLDIKTMRDAVQWAWKSAKHGDTILLSPGAASFNMFRNEFDRGDQFIKLVKNSR